MLNLLSLNKSVGTDLIGKNLAWVVCDLWSEENSLEKHETCQ